MFETIDPTPPEVGDGGKDSSASLGSPSSGATPKPAMSSFVEHLVRNKIVTEEVAIKATIWKNQLGGKDKRSMIDILVEEFGLSRDALHLEVAKFYSFRVVDLSDRSPRTLQSSQVHKLMS